MPLHDHRTTHRDHVDLGRRVRRAVLALGVAASLFTACSGSDDDEASTSSRDETDTETRAGTDSERPPLPRTPPEGPAVDRHLTQPADDFDPVAWTDLPPRPALEGPLAVNDLLVGVEIQGASQLDAPEDIAPGLDGHLYTGTREGGLWQLQVDGETVTAVERITTLDGPVLGIDAYDEQTVIAAVVSQGVVAVDTTTGDSWVLSDRLDGNLIYFPDGLDVATDGTIYYTEASTLYFPGFPYEFLEGRPRGRLLRYEPSTGETSVVVDEMYFPNGVALAPDESYALVAETARFRITQVDLTGDGADRGEAATSQYGTDLVNAPDNVRLDQSGRLWIGGGTLRSDLTDLVLSSVEVRRQAALLSEEEIESQVEPYGFAQVLGPDGESIFSFHDPTGDFSVSALLPHDGYVTFGTASGHGVIRLPIPAELAD